MTDPEAMEHLERARGSIERYLNRQPVTLETLRIADEWFTAIDAALDVLLRRNAAASARVPAPDLQLAAAPPA